MSRPFKRYCLNNHDTLVIGRDKSNNCKVCMREKCRLWRIKNPNYHKGYKYTNNYRRNFIQAHKNKPCVDCKQEYPPYVMDFDHLPQFEKTFTISSMKVASKEKLKQEIAKCEVVCANCHRIRTHNRQIEKKLNIV